MSTTTLAALCAGLFDDAAVFPPGCSPVDQAWLRHRELHQGPYAGCIGPLLLAPPHVTPLVDWLGAQDALGAPGMGGAPGLGVVGEEVHVVLVARAGVSLGDLDTALADLVAARPSLGLRVVGLEVAHTPGWQRLLMLGLPLVVEAPRAGHLRDRVLAEVAGARAAGHLVRAKLRTQATASEPVPSAEELADFLLACTDHGVPFKLTGGLHHAVATGTPTTDQGADPAQTTAEAVEHQHGALNVLLATHDVLHGTDRSEVTATLCTQDADILTHRTLELSATEVTGLRRAFTTYGCCGVLDPLTELTELGLLPPTVPATR